MGTTTYITGAVVRVAAEFTQAGTAVDPASVTAMVMLPDGTTTTYIYGTDAALVRSATGLYSIDVATAHDGRHKVRFASSGAGAGASEQTFFCKSSFV